MQPIKCFIKLTLVITLICSFYTSYSQTEANWIGWGNNDYSQISDYMWHETFIAIAAGKEYSLALKEDGTVVAWGSNTEGQTNVPEGLTGVKAIAAKNEHNLALKADGTVVAWGSNRYGLATVPAGLTDVKSIAVGGTHNLALKADGTVVGWGDNSSGQTNIPVGLTNVKAIAAGTAHSLALKEDGTVVAWGANVGAQTNVPADLTGVIAIDGGHDFSLALKADSTVVAWGVDFGAQTNVFEELTGVIAIAAGSYFGLALKADGTVVAWSRGADITGETNVPAGLTDIQAIAAGHYHSLALKADGSIAAWGSNNYGETNVPVGLTYIKELATGFGYTVALKEDGTVVAWGRNDAGKLNVPAGLHDVKAIAAGHHHNLALKTDGTVVAWGRNGEGAADVPEDLDQVTAIDAGYAHSIALKEDGTVVVWGRNSSGQDSVPIDLINVIAIAAGNGHNLALKADGTVVEWGGGNSSGNGAPAGLSNVKAIAAGGDFSIALKEDGTVVVWGAGSDNQSNILAGLTQVKKVVASQGQILALKEDGTLVTWGWSEAAQSEVPSTLNNVKGIAAGLNHSWAWGMLSPEISSTLSELTTQDSIPLTIDFPVRVSGFEISDLAIKNAQVAQLTTIDSIQFQAMLIPNAAGRKRINVSVYIPEGATSNASNSPVDRSNTFSIDYWPTANVIKGRIYQDNSSNCQFDASSDVPFSNYMVRTSPEVFYGMTKSDGTYEILVDTGVFDIEVVLPEIQGLLFTNSCNDSYQVQLDTIHEVIDELDFPLQVTECPILSVSVSSNRRRRCFESYTTITYQNEGFVAAANAKVYLKLPKYVEILSTDQTYSITADSVYVFDVGTLEARTFGRINIQDMVRCESGIVGLDQCTEVWITPANTCLANNSSPSSDWDGSSLAVEGNCISLTQGSRFIIRNLSDHDMTEPSVYRVYEDVNLASSDSFQLASGDSLILQYHPYSGSIRIEVDQPTGHPGNARPQATVTGCHTNIATRTSSANFFEQDDADIARDIDCLPIIDSFDPNDKMATPQGITEHRFVKPETTLDYRIRFQNTGTDTAYTVVVVDTLSTLMDISTLRMGAVSHDYTVELSGEGAPVLTWTFHDIDLPDSTRDEPNSHGFIKFSIAPLEGHPDGTIVHNEADIYFDFNEPIRTNDAWVNYYDTVLVTDNYAFGVDLDLPIPYFTASTATYVNAPFEVTVNINEAVDLDLQAFSVMNASVSHLSGSDQTYSVLVNPTTDGEVAVSLAEGSFADPTGNQNLESNTIRKIYDGTTPSVDWVYDTNHPFEVSASFNEEVTGVLTSSDFEVSGNTVIGFEENGGVYTLKLAAQLGDVHVAIAAGRVTDKAGNTNERIEQTFSITSTPSSELATLTTLAPNPTTGKLSVEFPWAERGIKTIQVIDLVGHILDEYQTTDERIHVNTHQFEAGTYILRIIASGQTVTKLFVKQ
ncbi:MAG: DUF7619 domain-containing protein [Flammeovirgaceae bacterium]